MLGEPPLLDCADRAQHVQGGDEQEGGTATQPETQGRTRVRPRHRPARSRLSATGLSPTAGLSPTTGLSPTARLSTEAGLLLTRQLSLTGRLSRSKHEIQPEQHGTRTVSRQVRTSARPVRVQLNTSSANTTHRSNVLPMLGQRCRRWANIAPTLVSRLLRGTSVLPCKPKGSIGLLTIKQILPFGSA